MLSSIAIKNFRCFEDIRVSDLGRVNVVVGDNRAGKTAFLEAIYLLCGNTPQNHLKIDVWRGLTSLNLRLSENDVVKGQLWRDLFRDFDFNNVISIRASSSTPGSPDRHLQIHFNPKPKRVAAPGARVDSPVEWKWSGGGEWKSVPRLEDGNLLFPGTPPGPLGAMLSTTNVNPGEMAQRYSDLDIKNESEPLVELIRQQFSEITALSTQAYQENSLMLYASMKGLTEKIPLPLVSAGLSRLIFVLLSVHTNAGGIVGVDEIDNGIFHGRYKKLWEAVNESSRVRQTQLFVSVHSSEALHALLPVLHGCEEDFRLIRLTREGSTSQARLIAGKSLAAAIAEDIEVR